MSNQPDKGKGQENSTPGYHLPCSKHSFVQKPGHWAWDLHGIICLVPELGLKTRQACSGTFAAIPGSAKPLCSVVGAIPCARDELFVLFTASFTLCAEQRAKAHRQI